MKMPRLTLTLRYILALSFIAMLSGLAFLTLRFAIAQQKTGAAVVNVAGRQRMLSQRISRYALQFVIVTDAAERESLRQILVSDIELFEKSHQTLVEGGQVRGLTRDEILVLPGNPTEVVQAMYFETPLSLDFQVVTFVAEARALLASSDAELTLENVHLQYIMRAAADELLTSLNTVTGQYQKESEESVSDLQRLEAGVLVVTLLALLAEALLIFRPMVQQMESRTRELQANLHTIEQQNRTMQSRSRALALSTVVSRSLSTILDEKRLVVEVVEQVKSAFSYYHAHIYMYNPAGNELWMAGGTGDVGQTLLARGHKLPKGKGLVGRAAESNVSVLVADTSKDSDWMPNPLLPETKAEVAVPISIGDKVLGVLDVQHNLAGGVTSDDVEMLETIASQVAIAIQNARSYSEARQRMEHETLIRSIGRKIQGTTTIENALKVVVQELGSALGTKETRIILDGPANE